MQRHFESEDHTEFTFYLCFWSARVFYSTMSVPITILAHIFRHISRDSWRCVYAAHGEGNRWQSAFTWKLLQCRKLKWFLVSEMREMQNEFSLSNFRVARKIEWKTIATSPFRITHDMQRTVISRIAQWLKVEKKTKENRRKNKGEKWPHCVRHSKAPVSVQACSQRSRRAYIWFKMKTRSELISIYINGII